MSEISRIVLDIGGDIRTIDMNSFVRSCDFISVLVGMNPPTLNVCSPKKTNRTNPNNPESLDPDPEYLEVVERKHNSVSEKTPYIVIDGLPCRPEHRDYIFRYLLDGTIPEVGKDAKLYRSMYDSMRYLLCEEAVQRISLDDYEINKMIEEDIVKNKDVEQLYPLFERKDFSVGGEDLYYSLSRTRPSKYIAYPLVAPPSRRSCFDRRPLVLRHAINSVFGCSRCKKKEFFDDLFTVFGNHICVAGGSCHAMFERVSQNHNGPKRCCGRINGNTTHQCSNCFSCRDTDTDVFFINMCQSNIDSVLRMIGYLYRMRFGEHSVLRTEYAITFFRVQKRHKNIVQFILRDHLSIGDVLSQFDLDASCIAYDGKNFYANARGVRSLQTSVNVVDVSRTSITFESRLFKYYTMYGIGIAVPGFDGYRSQIAAKEKKKKGLARLLTMLNYYRWAENDRSEGRVSKTTKCAEPEKKDGGDVVESDDEQASRRSYNNSYLPWITSCESRTWLDNTVQHICERHESKNRSIPFIIRHVLPETDLEILLFERNYSDHERTDTNLFMPVRIQRFPGCFRPVEGSWYAHAYATSEVLQDLESLGPFHI